MKLQIALCSGVLLLCHAASSQIITTIAGTDFTFPAGQLQALNAPLGTVSDVVFDHAGNLYIADSDNNLILRISPDGTATVVAGNGIPAYSGDGGLATDASLNAPSAIALDSAGNLYIADAGNRRIREVSNGIVTSIAGTGDFADTGDGGPAATAALASPSGIAVDAAGSIYFSDNFYNVVRKIANGVITRFAGTTMESRGFAGDNGPATAAQLSEPAGLAFDAAGNLYIVDQDNDCIRMVSKGIITTIAGIAGDYAFTGDGGPAVKAALADPTGIRFDSAGNLYVADTGNSVVRRIAVNGTITTVAGNNIRGFSGDGTPALRAKIRPLGVALDSAGDLFIADGPNYRVRKITGSGATAVISTVAGNGNFRFQGDGGPATSASLNLPQLVTVAPNGDLYVADATANRIRKISKGTITTVAGSGGEGFLDGVAPLNALLDNPVGVAVDAVGNIYIADVANNRVREVSNGKITTIAGSATQFGFNGDGVPAAGASLNNPSAVAVAPNGDLYIADHDNFRIRKVSNGIITTVVGTGDQGYSGDGGPATSAVINYVNGLAFDAAGNLYFSDFNFHAGNYIRKVSNGIISTIAGNAVDGYSGDGGPAVGAQLEYPGGVAVDSSGNVYIADTGNSVIRKISNGIISTFAGTGEDNFSGDGGPATNAALFQPYGVAVDANGNVFISDARNHRIREILSSPPSFNPVAAGPSLSLTQASGGKPVTATISVGANTAAVSSIPVPGLTYSTSVINSSPWLSVAPANGNTPGLLTVTADPLVLAPGTYNDMLRVSVPFASPANRALPVTFTVTQGIPPAVAVDQTHMSFTYSTTSAARSQTLIVSNSGGGVLNISTSVTLFSGIPANWLSVTPTTTTATPSTPASLAITADPSMLSAGTYTGAVTITGSSSTGAPAGTVTVPITMTITPNPLVMLLSQAGLTFTAVQGGGAVPPQTFGVLNLGSGTLGWTVQTSTLQGGNWLSATPASGSTSTASVDGAPLVAVSVNAAGLTPGNYYGLVQVISGSAANSPQDVVAVLQVLPAGTDVAPLVQPSSLLFTTTPDGSSPSSQTILVYDPTGTSKSFRSNRATSAGSLVTLPTDATVPANAPTQIVVQPVTSGLGPGTYTGTLTLQFSDGRVSRVGVTIVVPDGGSSGSLRPRSSHDAPACTPTKLIPVLTTLGPGFNIPAAFPEGLTAQIMDDCGSPLTDGRVSVEFSTGQGLKYMQSLGNGRWDVTWQTGAQNPSVTLSVHAMHQTLPIRGDAQITGALGALQPSPHVSDGGVVSAASFLATPAAPGGFISIFGSLLTDGTGSATVFPLPTSLNNTTVTLGDKLLPLFFTFTGDSVHSPQVNALVPYGTPINTNLQILLQRDNAYATPVSVDVAATQPEVLEYGSRQALAVDLQGQLIGPSNPAHANEVLMIFCFGLGAVSRDVGDGTPAPSDPPAATMNPVTVTMGNQTANVSFAGLAPRFAGLYQINVAVPPNAGTGDQVPVVISTAGQTGQTVYISVR